MEKVVLVDKHDKVLGEMEKMEAHRQAKLHRAFSVFVFNSENQLLLQRRATQKYHSGGLWTNTCCSHPRADESYEQAAHRRMQEEMGFDCALTPGFKFIYKAELDQGLTEHELDQVFWGYSDIVPNINSDEVAEFKYVSLDELDQQMLQHSEQFTAWFKIIYTQVKDRWPVPSKS